jgi:hypothetical protein
MFTFYSSMVGSFKIHFKIKIVGPNPFKIHTSHPAELSLLFKILLIFPLNTLTLHINCTIHNGYHQEFVRCQICSITRAVRCTFPCRFILLVAKITHCAKTGGIADPFSYSCVWCRSFWLVLLCFLMILLLINLSKTCCCGLQFVYRSK